MKKVQLSLLSMLTLLVVSACKPDLVELEVYSSDLQSAAVGDVVEVPIKATFRLLGEDKKNQLPQAKTNALKYMANNSEIEISKGRYGNVMTVVSTIPLGNKSALDEYFKKNRRLGYILVEGNKVVFLPSSQLQELNKDLRPINMMLSVDLPAKDTVFRITGDSKEKLNISATAVFSEKKPYLQYSKDVEKRKSVEIVFKGSEGSIYREIPPHFLIK